MGSKDKIVSKSKVVPEMVVKRLPKYYRYLCMIHDKGIVRISSQHLSDITGFTASQIRQDFNHFGGFGQQGYGYNVSELKEQLGKIIGVHKDYEMIIIGAGNMGRAISHYSDFRDSGFSIKAIFDSNENIIGTIVNDLEVLSIKKLPEYLQNNSVDIAVLTVPAREAQAIADIVSLYNVSGIWNFAPVDLKVNSNVSLENVHLDESLYKLTYYMSTKQKNGR